MPLVPISSRSTPLQTGNFIAARQAARGGGSDMGQYMMARILDDSQNDPMMLALLQFLMAQMNNKSQRELSLELEGMRQGGSAEDRSLQREMFQGGLKSAIEQLKLSQEPEKRRVGLLERQMDAMLKASQEERTRGTVNTAYEAARTGAMEAAESEGQKVEATQALKRAEGFEKIVPALSGIRRVAMRAKASMTPGDTDKFIDDAQKATQSSYEALERMEPGPARDAAVQEAMAAIDKLQMAISEAGFSFAGRPYRLLEHLTGKSLIRGGARWLANEPSPEERARQMLIDKMLSVRGKAEDLLKPTVAAKERMAVADRLTQALGELRDKAPALQRVVTEGRSATEALDILNPPSPYQAPTSQPAVEVLEPDADTSLDPFYEGLAY